MARRIEGTIYRLTYTATWHSFVECSSKEDLFKYIAHEVINGQIVTSVNEMCKDGSTPKVKVSSYIKISLLLWIHYTRNRPLWQ